MEDAAANNIDEVVFLIILDWIIGIAIFCGIVAIIVFIGKKIWNADSKQDPQDPKRKWYPTGWYWDQKTQRWTPPDYLSEEARNRWKWDPEKRIWIDLDKERRMERYRKYHKGREPTFEEWKAARAKEQHPET